MAAWASIAAGASSAASGIVGPTVGAIAGKKSQKRQMEFNSAEAAKHRQFENTQAVNANIFTRERDEWSAQQTEKSYQQQEYMFNKSLEAEGSAMQRRTADLKKAGLNPLMLYQGGGPAGSGQVSGAATTKGGSASKGSGSAATSSAQTHDFSGLSKAGLAVNNALSAKKAEEEINLLAEKVNTERAMQRELMERSRSIVGKIEANIAGIGRLYDKYGNVIKKGITKGADNYMKAAKERQDMVDGFLKKHVPSLYKQNSAKK